MNSPSLTLVVVVAVLVAVGVYLILERSLTRVLIGLILLGNGINVLLLVAGGAAGGPPIVGVTDPQEMADPLPQALILTAIVITLGMTAFVLALAYRSWQLSGHDEVQDDQEDRRVARRAALDRTADFEDVEPTDLAAQAAEVHDETEIETSGDGEHGDRAQGRP